MGPKMAMKEISRISTRAATAALFLARRSMASLKKPMGGVSNLASFRSTPICSSSKSSSRAGRMGWSGICCLKSAIAATSNPDTGINDSIGQVHDQDRQQGDH